MPTLFQTQLSIKSNERTSGDINNFVVKINPTAHIEKIALESISIPFTWYNIDSNNNSIRFNDGTQRDVTIPVGVYSSSTIITAIKTAMDGAPSTLVFTVTYNNITKKITIAETGGPTNFDLQFNINNSLGPLLGYGLNNFTGAATYTANNVFDVNQNNHSISIYSRELTRYNSRTITSNHKMPMLRIPNNISLWGGIIEFENIKDYVWDYDPGKTLQEIDIRITDNNDNDIDFNGIDEIMLNFKIYTQI
jgi:hypothetical protein